MTAASETDRPTTLAPPEQFWKRYSPHHEAPLSAAGSFALHALGVGALALAALYLGSLFFRPARSLPVDPVQLSAPGKPGPDGPAPGPGIPGDPDLPQDPARQPPAVPQLP